MGQLGPGRMRWLPGSPRCCASCAEECLPTLGWCMLQVLAVRESMVAALEVSRQVRVEAGGEAPHHKKIR